MPFSEADPVEKPLSVYAATKRANELMAFSYSHLYSVQMIGLRFFTVYGPYGRPDMALFMFTKAILAGQPIEVYNQGDMKRDFTYIDDIVNGIAASLQYDGGSDIFNLARGQSIALDDFIAAIEQVLGKKAVKELKDIQPGDVQATWGDIRKAQEQLGYRPAVSVAEGVRKFIDWYRSYYGV